MNASSTGDTHAPGYKMACITGDTSASKCISLNYCECLFVKSKPDLFIVSCKLSSLFH